MRVAIFGGRFDPPHVGHLRIAEEAREALTLDEVRFVPAGTPPHKGVAASAEARLAMTRAATEDHPAFRVDDLEVRREGPSYAIDTVESMRADAPQDEFWYLIGADAYLEIASWHRAEELVRTVRMLVVPRPGTERARLDALDEPFRSAASHLTSIPLDVSGTELRRRARTGRSLRYLTPEAVRRYLDREHPYAPNELGEEEP